MPLNISSKGKNKKQANLLPANTRAPDEIPDVLTDQRIAQSFADFYHEGLLYWPEAGKWIVYDGRRWTTESPGGPYPFLKAQIAIWHLDAAAIKDDEKRIEQTKKILSLENHYRQETIIKAAKVIPTMLSSTSQLDNDPMLLNCLNGTLNLRTGELRPHDPNDFITRNVYVEYDLSATCPIFDAFLDRIFAGNQDIIEYVQRFFGYCLTGKTDAQILLFLYGLGANGKTCFANILRSLLGDFASTAGSGLLMVQERGKPGNDLAALRGSRLVVVSEFNDNERINEAQVKTLTGQDAVNCRFLYGEFFSYIPQFKILLLGNHKPCIRGTDLGIWRRIHLLPFNITIPEEERDPRLLDKMKSELPGILAWAVQGCLDWQRTGLCPPEEVKAATAEYRQSEDVFSGWLAEYCVIDPNFSTPANRLLESYQNFTGLSNVSPQKFGRMLTTAGFTNRRGAAGMLWDGIGLRA